MNKFKKGDRFIVDSPREQVNDRMGGATGTIESMDPDGQVHVRMDVPRPGEYTMRFHEDHLRILPRKEDDKWKQHEKG